MYIYICICIYIYIVCIYIYVHIVCVCVRGMVIESSIYGVCVCVFLDIMGYTSYIYWTYSMNVSLKIVDLLGSTLAKSSSEVSNIPFGHKTWLNSWKKNIYIYIYIHTYVHTNTESFKYIYIYTYMYTQTQRVLTQNHLSKFGIFCHVSENRGDSCPLSPETILKNLEDLEDLGSKLQSYIHPRLIGDLGPKDPKAPLPTTIQAVVSTYSQNFPPYLQSTSKCCFQ